MIKNKAPTLGILFLHALPLDGTMWDYFKDILPKSTYSPTMYLFGDTVEKWSIGALENVEVKNLIVVGCSIGGSCALEIANIAPEMLISVEN